MTKKPITAEMIKTLRERTGIGMGKCKEALEEADGDMELAISNLRKAGMATAVKKEGRATNEGQIGTAESSAAIAIVEINAETDFVAKNERFKQFVENIANEAAATKPASLEAFLQQKYSKEPGLTVDQYRATIVQTIGENIQIRRLMIIPKAANKTISVYSHLGGKLVTMVELTGSNKQDALAKDVAMHVAAASPEYLSPEKVPADIISQEKEIAKSQIKGKPDNIVDKIVEGKIKSFYDANCLICQKYIRDDSLTIADLIAKRSKENGTPCTVTSFMRWSVGQ